MLADVRGIFVQCEKVNKLVCVESLSSVMKYRHFGLVAPQSYFPAGLYCADLR